ncbi:cbb3-type cytochrome c oxidase subunit III [Aliiruegeria haliotis]|uniref:Cbb3-type cytochrome c oxidase subunit III n=1 Tax=Aliiruegeria haliotis TaxID=1280846 RepID=A0A2T0RKT9_9RHOB|nr:c-type cytochrome [Aliiruegeria haliotis]PRY21741.1 cbb3-type cytochrome c oxidase subunit III [Aliiruegeria haliotis]
MKPPTAVVLALACPTSALAEGVPVGEAIYLAHCMECHMASGAGDDIAPDIRGIPSNNLRRAMGGLEGMPEFDFSDEELAAILGYLKSLDR